MNIAHARVRAATALMMLGAAGCIGDRKIRLGDGAPAPYQFEPPVLIQELAAAGAPNANGTLTGDEREIFFTTLREASSDVWHATRASVDAPFGTAVPVTEVNGDTYETSAAISTDGLALWFGSDRAGGSGSLDVWTSVRSARTSPWSVPVNVVALNSMSDDIPRPPGLHQTVMPLSSTKPGAARAPAGTYHTYLAARSGAGGVFGSPVAVSELDQDNRSVADAFLTDDGLTLFFAASVAEADAATPGNGDLYVAWRRSTSEPFLVTQALDDLNTTADELDPWLNPAGTTLYFTSTRDGVSSIYTARVKPR